MPDPTLRQLLEQARPVRDLFQALQALAAASKVVEDAQSVEGTMRGLRGQLEGLHGELRQLATRRAGLEAEVTAERDSLLRVVHAERDRVVAETNKIRATAEADQRAFDEERGRRTSILRALDEQATDAKKRNAEEVQALRVATDAERGRLHVEISEVRAKAALVTEDLAQLRAEYQSLQEAGARLFGRR
jgi:hypothetical protein